jgi:hypothetical protein
MASIDTLPADQHAVLQLVLQRHRNYDDIAQLLSIDRAAVRERALAALDALAPGTRVAPERRALITDYLLAQLPAPVAAETRQMLARSPGERAWARVVASELAPMAGGSLPEIPADAGVLGDEPLAREAEGAATESPRAAAVAPAAAAVAPGPAAAVTPAPGGATPAAAESSGPPPSEEPAPDQGGKPPAPGRRSSRRGGAILLAGGAVVAVAAIVAVILILSGGSTSKHSSTAASNAATTSAAASTQTSTAASATPRPVAQVNLTSPAAGSKTRGAAVIVKQGSNAAIEIIAEAVPANTTHDAYAVWLYNSGSDNRLLGFVNPGIKKDGVLRTLGALPANASHFKQLLVTRETQAKPRAPGSVVLHGAFNLPAS